MKTKLLNYVEMYSLLDAAIGKEHPAQPIVVDECGTRITVDCNGCLETIDGEGVLLLEDQRVGKKFVQIIP